MTEVWPVRVFRSRTEVMFLGLSLLALIGVTYEVLFWVNFLSNDLRISFRFMSDVLFLGTIHASTSFALLLTLPEFKAWIHDRTNGRPWVYWLELGIVSAAIFFLVVGLTVTAKGRGRLDLFLIIFILLDFFGGRHHIQQFKGFSLQYNHALRQRMSLNPGQLDRLANLEIWEKRLFDWLPFTCALTQASVSTALLTNFRSIRLDVIIGSAGLTLILCLALLGLSLAQPYASESGKSYFLLRILLLPFRSISLIGNVLLRVFHGLEFLALLFGVGRNTSAPPSARRRFAFACIGIASFAAVCTSLKGDLLGPWVIDNQMLPKDLLIVFVALNAVFNYSHYFMDWQMFTFRDPRNRKHILPLLKIDQPDTTNKR